MKNLVLFDWNGTLYDDVRDWFNAVKDVFKYYGKKPPTLKQYFAELQGDYLEIYHKRGINISREELGKIYDGFYWRRTQKSLLFPHAVKILKILSKDQDTAIGLVTMQKGELCESILEKFNIRKYFDYTRFHVLNKTATIKELMKKEKVSPKRCWYVGDAPADMRNAKSAGVRGAALFHGAVPLEYFANTGAFIIICDLDFVIPLVLGNPD